MAICSAEAGRPQVSVTLRKSLTGMLWWRARLAPEGQKGRCYQDPDVVQQRPSTDVLETEPHLLRPDQLGVRSVRIGLTPKDRAFVVEPDRSPIGDPGAHEQELALLWTIAFDLLGDLRPRSDHAHVA